MCLDHHVAWNRNRVPLYHLRGQQEYEYHFSAAHNSHTFQPLDRCSLTIRTLMVFTGLTQIFSQAICG